MYDPYTMAVNRCLVNILHLFMLSDSVSSIKTSWHMEMYYLMIRKTLVLLLDPEPVSVNLEADPETLGLRVQYQIRDNQWKRIIL